MKQAVKAEVLRRAKTSAAMNTAASSRSDKRVDFHLCVFGFCSTVDVVETNQNLRVCVVLASQQVTRHCGENKKHIIVISTLCVCVCVIFDGCAILFGVVQQSQTIPSVFISVQGSCAANMATSPLYIYLFPPFFSLSGSSSLVGLRTY